MNDKNMRNEIQLLTAQAVGEKLKLSKRQVFRLRSAGLICASVKVGNGAVRWRSSDIERWIALGCPDRKTFEARKESEKC